MARRFAEAVGSLMFAAVFVIFCMKIVARYAFQNEMAWADEVSIILFIWIIFWADAFVLSDHEHIRFDLVYQAVPARAKRGMAIARAVLIGGLFLYAAPATLDYITFLWRERTPVLGLRLDHVDLIFGVFVVTVPLRAAWSLWTLCRPGWRTRL